MSTDNFPTSNDPCVSLIQDKQKHHILDFDEEEISFLINVLTNYDSLITIKMLFNTMIELSSKKDEPKEIRDKITNDRLMECNKEIEDNKENMSIILGKLYKSRKNN